MNTKEFVANMVAETGMTKAECKKALKSVVSTMTKTFEKGERLEMHNLGVFKVVDRAPRSGRNPNTGERIEIPAKKSVMFKLAAGVKL